MYNQRSVVQYDMTPATKCQFRNAEHQHFLSLHSDNILTLDTFDNKINSS